MIRFLHPWNGHDEGSTAELDADVEARLVSRNLARRVDADEVTPARRRKREAAPVAEPTAEGQEGNGKRK